MPESKKLAVFVGKGGTGKTTAAAYVLKHFERVGVPCAGHDADEPGEHEPGSLYALSEIRDVGAPVYRTAAATRLKEEALRHTPDGGVGVIDTGAWERKVGNNQLAAMAAADLILMFTKPTGMDLHRAGSVFAARDQLEAFGVRVAPIGIVISMADGRTRAASKVRDDLGKGLVVMGQIPLSNAETGYANVWDNGFTLTPGDSMHLLGERILKELHHG